MNVWIENRIRDKSDEITTASKKLFDAGLLLPLGYRSSPTDNDVRVIIGVLPELAKVFNTKTRAPYMVAFETVALSEVEERLKPYFYPHYEDTATQAIETIISPVFVV